MNANSASALTEYQFHRFYLGMKPSVSRPFVCRRCKTRPQFSRYNQLRAHLRCVHRIRALQREELVHYENPSFNFVEAHGTPVRDVGHAPYVCRRCVPGRILGSYSELRFHLLTIHFIRSITQDGLREFQILNFL